MYIIDRSGPKKSGGKCPFKYSDLLIFFLKVYGGEEGSVSIRVNGNLILAGYEILNVMIIIYNE